MLEVNKRHEWTLEGIDCANCAAKIEAGVAKIDGISISNVNFMTKTLSFEIADQVTTDREKNILAQVKNRIAVLEPDVTPLLKISREPIGQDGCVIDHQEKKEQSHSSENEHSHPHGDVHLTGSIVRLIVTVVLLLMPIILTLPGNISFWIYVAAYLTAGYDVVWRAVKNIFRGQVFDENFLMTIATISAFYIQQYPEAVSVMLFYQIGELFQDIAVNRSRRSISALMDIRPDYANKKKEDNSTEEVAPDVIQVGDVIVIRPGEKVPLDGRVINGSSSVDTSALTGESLPKKVEEGDQVLSGFINRNGLLEVQVEKTFGESTVVKILDLVENASSRKATTENFITKFARYYTPIVVVIALLLALIPPFLLGADFNDWLYRASIFLVISCPCALVVSIPVGFFSGIGSASKKGILVKGSNFLEGLNDVKYVVMDKTGTLTKGKFEVTNIDPTAAFSKEELLEITAIAELHSSHPIADSVKDSYGKKIDSNQVTGYNEIAGQGIQAQIAGREVLVGNSKLMDSFSISYETNEKMETIIYVAVDKKFGGSLVIADAMKEDAAESIQQMKRQGISHLVMLTGDSKMVGESVAKQLGIDEVYTELLPQDKVEKMEELMKRKKPKEKIIFVGDGINDTPVLARSDIGIAMGGLGSDAAIEAADIVIMNDQPSKIAVAMQVAKDTRRIVWQNIIFAMAVKGVFLLLGAFGVATMWEAVFADVGVTVIAVLNSMRMMRK